MEEGETKMEKERDMKWPENEATEPGPLAMKTLSPGIFSGEPRPFHNLMLPVNFTVLQGAPEATLLSSLD